MFTRKSEAQSALATVSVLSLAASPSLSFRRCETSQLYTRAVATSIVLLSVSIQIASGDTTTATHSYLLAQEVEVLLAV